MTAVLLAQADVLFAGEHLLEAGIVANWVP
jgi:hypothetical protein